MNTTARLATVFGLLFVYATSLCAQEHSPVSKALDSTDFIHPRGGLDNCRIKFGREKTGRIAYLGGSITTMQGWRALTYELFRTRFPETEFDFIDAGIGGTNSTLGA